MAPSSLRPRPGVVVKADRGAYGFPLERATRIALREVQAWLVTDPGLERVVFCCFSEGDRETYARLAHEVLGGG